jgi:hypothetical protein
MKVLVQLIGSELATAEDAELMSALAVGIQDQELDRPASPEGVPGVRPGAAQAQHREVHLPSRNKTVPVGSAAAAHILLEAERLIDATRERTGQS